MRFRLTEDQRQLQDMAERLATAPDAHAGLRAVIDGKADHDAALWQRLAEFGAPGLLVPAAHGGAGMTLVETALVAEMLGRAGAAVPFLGHMLATLAIARGGDEAQRARWLPALATGERIATVAIDEPGDAWDPARWTTAGDTTATGRKVNVPSGLQADLLVVGLAGGTLGIVELPHEAVRRRAMDGIDLTRPLAAIELDGAPLERLEGDPQTAEHMRDAALVLLAADAYGGASHCLAMATDYADLREAFGAKLAQFQGVKHQLANIALEVEPCHGLYWFAAYACANLPKRAAHAAALAKAHICETFANVSRLNIELHGGIGFTWEHDAHIWMKRAMFDYAWGGGSRDHFGRAADLARW